jgi:phosphoadenosine phosphosulfate reductase
MTSPVTLWQPPPRASVAPLGFATQLRELKLAIAGIGQRYARAALASSLSVEDVLLTHAIASSDAPIDVFYIDTGRLDPETLAVATALEERFGVTAIVVHPDPAAVTEYVATHGANAFYDSVELRKRCCHLRKVEPLERALSGRDAWLTGQRRAHGPERARLAEHEFDAARGIAKFNPLAAWSDAAVWHYARQFDLPVNALYARGYASIGCAPCSRAIRGDEPLRAGRWWWEDAASKECGLHVAPAAVAPAAVSTLARIVSTT